jgi:protein-S-isoprenylcysteine O-methyltransferase Ste14
MEWDWTTYGLYALGWLSFALLHSLLARDGVKQVLKPHFGAFYRLAYNGFACLHILAVYVLGVYLFADGADFMRPSWLWWTQGIMHGMGWIVLIWALREYDLGTFSGFKQVREHFQGILAHDEEPLHFDGFHRWVRHPLYSAAFLILWGRINNEFDLLTALFGSLYLWIGSRFEERHLLRTFGDHYATYKSRVPAFFPYKGQINLKEPRP